jgi:hypothetical protein
LLCYDLLYHSIVVSVLSAGWRFSTNVKLISMESRKRIFFLFIKTVRLYKLGGKVTFCPCVLFNRPYSSEQSLLRNLNGFVVVVVETTRTIIREAVVGAKLSGKLVHLFLLYVCNYSIFHVSWSFEKHH